MLRKKPRRARQMSEINVVPYIDVMLVLLVIFMITTPLLTQGVKIALPQAQAKPIIEKQNEPVIVSVDKAGRYYLNIATDPERAMAPQQLAVRVAAQLDLDHEQGIQRPVLIKGDKDVEYGKVVQAMVLLQKAGVADVGLMTSPPDQG